MGKKTNKQKKNDANREARRDGAETRAQLKASQHEEYSCENDTLRAQEAKKKKVWEYLRETFFSSERERQRERQRERERESTEDAAVPEEEVRSRRSLGGPAPRRDDGGRAGTGMGGRRVRVQAGV